MLQFFFTHTHPDESPHRALRSTTKSALVLCSVLFGSLLWVAPTAHAHIPDGEDTETSKKEDTETSATEDIEASTDKDTEDSTDKDTEDSTDKDTEDSTDKDTEASTNKDTEDSTKKDTEASTNKDTEDSTKKDTEDSTKKDTETSTEEVTKSSKKQDAAASEEEQGAKPKTEDDTEEEFTTQEYVVTGTRTRRHVTDTPVKTELIPKERIEAKGAGNLSEALRNEVGVHVDNQCSICNTIAIKLMGMPGRYTLLLIDGMPMFSSLGTVYGYSYMNAADIDRIEIVKGAASVLYGTDAIGGVINIITKAPSKKGHVSASLGGGMYGFHEMNVHSSVRRDKFGVSIVANHAGQNSIDSDSDGVSEYAGYSRTSAATAATWTPDAKTKIILRVAGIQEKRQGGGLGSFLTVINDWNPTDGTGRRGISESVLTKRIESGLTAHRRFTNKAWSESQVSYIYHHQDSDYEGVVYRGNQHMFYASQIVGFRPTKDWTLLGGLSYRMEHLDENLALSEYTYHVPGVFAQGAWRYASWGEAVAGIRYDWHNEFGHVVTPRVNLKFKPIKLLTIRAGTGTGFRAPTTFFEYEHGVRPHGYDLIMEADKPETSINATLSATFSYKKWITATVEGSFNRVNNPIGIEADTQGHMRVFNVDESLDVIAAETQISSRPLKYLWFDLGYGAYHYRDDGGALVSAPPKHHLTASINFNYRPSKTKALLWGQLYSPMDLRKVYGWGYNALPSTRGDEYLDPANADTNSPKRRRSPWWGVVNARVEQGFNDWFSVYVGVENIFDYKQTDKESPLFFPTDGPGGAPDFMDVVYIWGPMRGRFVYGGVKFNI